MGYSRAKLWSYSLFEKLGLPRALAENPRRGLTATLYHHFFAAGESAAQSAERLRRQLDWISSQYSILSMSEAFEHLSNDSLPPFPLIVTIDDAERELLDVHHIFEQFGIRPLIGVVTGWTSRWEEGFEEPGYTHLIDLLHWYNGPPAVVCVGSGEQIPIRPDVSRDAAIDRLLTIRSGISAGEIAEIAGQLRGLVSRTRVVEHVCDWSELRDLKKAGAEIASHTVSHCALAVRSHRRVQFEIEESRLRIEERLGPCADFVYPYGTEEVHSASTRQFIADSGYRSAFLTRAAFATNNTDPYELPRIVIPDHLVELSEFKARVRGGQIPFDFARRAPVRIGKLLSG